MTPKYLKTERLRNLFLGSGAAILVCGGCLAVVGSPATLTKDSPLNVYAGSAYLGRQMFPAGTVVDATPSGNGKVQVTTEYGATALLPADGVHFDSLPPATSANGSPARTTMNTASAGASMPASADFQTVRGQVYKNARVAHVEPDGVTYFYAGGAVKVLLDDLPEAVKAKYDLTPAKAAAFLRAQVIANQQAAHQEKDERNRRMAEDLKAMTLSPREVESDMPSYIGQDFVVHGVVDVTSTYLWGYGDAQNTHYAFVISDGRGTLYCYGSKGSLSPLRWNLLNNGPQKGRFVVKILPDRFLKGQTGLTAEILGPGHLDAELAPY